MDNGKEIIGFKSIDGPYFKIWKDDGVFHLKNKYTEIPNEFNKYDVSEIEDMFDDLNKELSCCKQVQYCTEKRGSCFRVIYSDKTEAIFQDREGCCSFGSNVARFSEFSKRSICGTCSDVITIDHIRWVCKTKTEKINNIIDYFKMAIEDDYIDVVVKICDGKMQISKCVCGFEGKPFLIINSSGNFSYFWREPYLELLHDNGVRLIA